MAQKKNTQEKLLNTIKAVVAKPENERFANELRKALGEVPVFSNSNISNIEKDVRLIRKALNIRGHQSINYSFVKSEVLRKQLIVDNLRMEDTVLDLEIKDFSKRLRDFSLNAFYQVEGLVNYYYSVACWTNIADHIQDCLNKSGFERKLTDYEKENGLSSITIANKLTALGIDLKLSPVMGASLYYLRDLRNGSSHRPFPKNENPSSKEKDKQRRKEYFWRNQSFESIRSIVSSLASIIQKDLSTTKYFSATVTQVLPSAVFVSIEEKGVFDLPLKLVKQNENSMRIGNTIKVGVTYETGEMRIVDIG